MNQQNNQTKKNFVFNIINLVINVFIAIFYLPFLVKSLGVAAYGIVPLALIINQYIKVLTLSLTNSLTRFYSISIEKKLYSDASTYLSSSFIVITIIVIILIPFFIWIVNDIDKIFNIPIYLIYQTKLLFIFSLSAFILSLYSSLLNITLYAKNRLDSLNIIGIARLFTKILLTISLFIFISSKVSFIGLASLFSEFIVLLLSVIYFNKSTSKEVKISFFHFNRIAVISILSMTSWVIVHQIGDTTLYRIDTILVNKFWSTSESGIIGIFSEFGTYVMTALSVITTLFVHLILIAYSNKNHKELKKLIIQNSLFVGLLTSFFVGVIIGFSKPLLFFWLSNEYIIYYDWFILKLVTIPFIVSSGIFTFVFRSWNKVMFPAIITFIIGALNFFICYLILTLSNGNTIYIKYMLIASSVFILLQSYGLNSFWLIKIYPELRKKVMYIGFKILSALILTAIISIAYNTIFEVNTIIDFVIGLILVSLATFPLLFFAFLDDSNKKILINLIFNRYFLK